VLVVLPLLELGRQGGGGTESPSPGGTVPPGGQTVIVPDLVGMPTQDAIAAARAAGLDWTVRCNEDPSRPEGIIDQEPPAGAEVARGSPFNLFSARIDDCR
jgi:beta-lactam-binding protein with PASTA domain